MYERDPGTDPVTALWQAVLQTAVDDALTGSGSGGGSRASQRLEAVHEARRYLTTPSADLTTVCLNAGLDPDAVIEHMTRRIAAAPIPEELVAAGALASRLAQKPKPKPKLQRPPFKNVLFTYNGTTRTAAEWAASLGLTVAGLYDRIRVKKWPLDRALTLTKDEAQHLASQERAKRSASHARTRKNVENLALARQRLAEDVAKGKTWVRNPERTISHDGLTLTLREWSERTGIKKQTITTRLAKGMSIAEALTPGRAPRRERRDAQISTNDETQVGGDENTCLQIPRPALLWVKRNSLAHNLPISGLKNNLERTREVMIRLEGFLAKDGTILREAGATVPSGEPGLAVAFTQIGLNRTEVYSHHREHFFKAVPAISVIVSNLDQPVCMSDNLVADIEESCLSGLDKKWKANSVPIFSYPATCKLPVKT